MDIESLIQTGFLKNFVARTEQSRSFASGGETSGAREVSASQISGTALVGKRPWEEGEVVISFSEAEIGHTTCPYKDA